MPEVTETVRGCLYCGKELVRREKEWPSVFIRRKCCNATCALAFTAARKRKKPIIGVYQIRNLPTGKVYIGSSNNVLRRWEHHREFLRKGKHRSKYLQRAWNKHGPEAFEFTVLEQMEDTVRLIECEQYWIDKTKCYKPRYGYNLVPIAGRTTGKRFSAAERARMSRERKGRNAGSKHGASKLTEADVIIIKQRLVRGDTLTAIASDFHVCFQTVSLIRSGKVWTHVKGPELTTDEKQRMFAARYTGSANHQAKLTETKVAEIKNLLAQGISCLKIAKEYGVNHRLISAINCGHVWASVPWPTPPLLAVEAWRSEEPQN